MLQEPPDMGQKKPKLRDYSSATNLIILWFYFDALKLFLRYKYLKICKINMCVHAHVCTRTQTHTQTICHDINGHIEY